MHTLPEVLAEATKMGRVCPKPEHWNRLWSLLPNRRRLGAGWEPPLPLILGAWGHTTDEEKRERFHGHIQWADSSDSLESIAQFIFRLNPDDWHIEE